MNLAFIAKRYDTVGGTEVDLYELTRRLAVRGHEIHIYCAESRQPPVEGIHLHPIPQPPGGRTARLWSVGLRGPSLADGGRHDLTISYARCVHQDIVRCGGGPHIGFLKQMAAAETAPKRFLRRIDPYHRSLLWIERRQFSSGGYKRIIAISERVKDEIMEVYPVSAERISVVYDGIDLSRFQRDNAEARGAAVRRRYQVPLDAPTLLFVGNAFKRKGLDTLLAAVSRLKELGLHAFIVGDDPQAGAYRERARELDVDDRVRFTGIQADPADFYAAADLFVLPALHEAFGNVVLEALAAGLPVIVSARAGAAEVLEKELAGYLLRDPSDLDALVRLIAAALEPGHRQLLSRTARETAQDYSLEAHTTATERVYEEVLGGKRRRH